MAAFTSPLLLAPSSRTPVTRDPQFGPNPQDYRQAQADAGTPVLTGERGIELSCRAQLWEGATIQPDLQYVMTPGGARGAPDVLIGAVRFAMAF